MRYDYAHVIRCDIYNSSHAYRLESIVFVALGSIAWGIPELRMNASNISLSGEVKRTHAFSRPPYCTLRAFLASDISLHI